MHLFLPVTTLTIGMVAVLMRYARNTMLAVFGLVVVAMTIACVGAMLAGIDYATPNPTIMKDPPCAEHLFGTDTIGRDLLARVLY